MPRFLQFLREFWPMPLPLMIYSAFALFAQRTRIPTSARSIGFCVIWVCISSSSSSRLEVERVQFCTVVSGGEFPILRSGLGNSPDSLEFPAVLGIQIRLPQEGHWRLPETFEQAF